MAKAKEKFEEPQDDVVAVDAEPVEEEEYVDPSVEYKEGEEPEPDADPQAVVLGLHPFGVQLVATAKDGTRAAVIITVEEAFNLAGNLTGLATFHMHMSIQQQMQQQMEVQQMMAQQAAPERRTKSGIIVKG